MRTRLWAAAILILCAGLAFALTHALTHPSRPDSPALATCTGATPCNACKNCSSCGLCAKRGGSCGACVGKPKRVAVKAAAGEELLTVVEK